MTAFNDPNLPFLPPELEQEIFEIATLQHPDSIPNLLLVSRRVRQWVETIKYRTIFPHHQHSLSIRHRSTCSEDELLEAIESKSKSADFFRERVRHLFVEGLDETELETVFSVCDNIRSLVILSELKHPGHFFSLKQLTTLRPIRLGLYFNELVQATDTQSPHPLLTSVTHFDLFDMRLKDDIADRLALLPALTHLSIWRSSATPGQVSAVLTSCRKLKALVAIDNWRKEPFPEFHTEDASYSADLRVVSVILHNPQYLHEWVTGTYGGIDFWARADVFIGKRRRGEIEASTRH
ncbi:hypothetical protein R3P38DRAFT_2858019 [Favolaschia claudopus]|uniref:F-box domain-containing protein n=1 Tax=Favolaschia claudopus TaxID=2862362 RepID=A0AAW0DGP2_9AGAR